MDTPSTPIKPAPGISKKNKRAITIAIVVVVLIIAAILLYKYWYKPNYIDNKKPADNVKKLAADSSTNPEVLRGAA